MKAIRVLVLLGLLGPAWSQQIFRAKWNGVGVQSFSAPGSTCVKGFQVSGPDAQGYVTLEAVTSEGQVGAIVRGKWQGFGVQPFQGSTCIQRFSVTGPDAQGYIRLIAIDANGQQGEILRSNLVGVGFQDYALAGEVVKGFQASGPDAQGYVYLSVITVPVGTQVGEDLGDQTENPQNPVVLQLSSIHYRRGIPVFSLRIPKGDHVVMRVYSPLGRLVIQREIQTQSTHQSVALPHLPRGLYFVHFEGKTASIQKRVLVLR